MFRRLLIYRSDLREMTWFRLGRLAPMPAGDERVEMRWVDKEAWLANPAILPTAPAVVRQRYAAYSRCLIGIDQTSGKTVYHLWLSTGSVCIDWIFRSLTAPQDGVLIFDVWVEPSLRGGAVHRLGAALAVREAVRLGRPAIEAGVEAHEYPSFATLYARMGLGICRPLYVLSGLRLGAGFSFHWRGSPPARLRKFGERLRRRYPERSLGKHPFPAAL